MLQLFKGTQFLLGRLDNNRICFPYKVLQAASSENRENLNGTSEAVEKYTKNKKDRYAQTNQKLNSKIQGILAADSLGEPVRSFSHHRKVFN